MAAFDIESQYKELLTPIKDLEKCFNVDIANLLKNFISDLFTTTQPVNLNFNSVALLLQGCTSLFTKKVQYLYDLATQLCNTLVNQNKDDEQTSKKETKDKEKRNNKQEKINDPFLPVEFKMGKNLSCLRKKNTSKAATKKSSKKSKGSSVAAHLLSNDSDDKGHVFYDTRGEIVGNKGDFAINKCRMMSSGWLLLPTVNPNLIPPITAVPDFYDDPDLNGGLDVEINLDDIEAQNPVISTNQNIQPSASDEGFGSGPSSENQEPTPIVSSGSESNATESPAQSSTAPPSTDEGISTTPNDIEMDNSPGNENIPAQDAEEGRSNVAPQPVRQAIRQALKTCQLAVDDDPLAGIEIDKELLVRKKIERKNVRCLPAKLKRRPGEEDVVPSISQYCARTFFAIEDKGLKKSLLNFDSIGFDKNSKFVSRIFNRLTSLKISTKNKLIDPIEDEQELNVEDVECLQEANEDDEQLCTPFDDNDIQINHDMPLSHRETPPPQPSLGEDGIPAADLPSLEVTTPYAEYERHVDELNIFYEKSDITERVQEWEKEVKPFLELVEKREPFDINLYGSRILNAFEDSNRKQTMTFRHFCRFKEKWEIHRYFMALLPLANNGNVSLETELKPDGTEEVFITLLSRKMHHKELEEFGHNDGSHP